MTLAKRPPLDEETGTQQQRLALIGRRVLCDLGEPANLQRVQVRHLWGDCYRVNVLAGLDVVSAKVAHSYFLTVGETGDILSSTPPVVRTYSLANTGGEAGGSHGCR
jgi:hypothetical protein